MIILWVFSADVNGDSFFPHCTLRLKVAIFSAIFVYYFDHRVPTTNIPRASADIVLFELASHGPGASADVVLLELVPHEPGASADVVLLDLVPLETFTL